MLHRPKTYEEAAQYRYGTWAGNPKGRQYDPSLCAYEVTSFPTHLFCQCSKRSGHGAARLYCKQHAKIVGE